MKVRALLAWRGARCESAEVAAQRGASADSGSTLMKLADAIERDSRKSGGVVFSGTSVPIELLFEFLEDNQTMDTFLDQFPMVSRDQARAVLRASRDMLLGRSQI